MIMFDDDDDVVVVDDDVERTRTGPYAVHSDVEHLVNHNANIYIYIYLNNVFSSYEEGGPTCAGKSRCLAVFII